jgi:hypothetical protein
MTPPSIVLELAAKEGKSPISWFVGDDHVTIVYGSGEKIRYDRDLEQPALIKPNQARATASAASAPKSRSRSKKK